MSWWAKLTWAVRYRDVQIEEVAAYLDSIRPYLEQPLHKVPLVALDMEMTGLDCQRDQILAVGLQPFNLATIKLAQASYQECCIDGSVGQSAVIHGIVDQQLSNGLSGAELFSWLMQQIHGRVLVVHCVPLDIGFLAALMQRLFGYRYSLPAIDTMALERHLHRSQQGAFNPLDYRLSACRQRYHLPNYQQHHALTDALACAELLMAQTQTIKSQALSAWL